MALGPYTGTVESIAPSLTDDNLFLTGGAGEVGIVVFVEGSGEMTTTTAMRTRWAISSGQAGSATAGNVAKGSPNLPTNTLTFGTTFATTQPTLDAGSLYAASWNAHGGIVRWQAKEDAEGWMIIGASTEKVISCRNAVGTGTSTFVAMWKEF